VRLLGPEDGDEAGWLDWMWSSDEGHPMAGQLFLVTMKAQPDKSVSIRLQSQDSVALFDKREEQGLLALIKGNID
jgi:outer membrane protein assembly factor BamC